MASAMIDVVRRPAVFSEPVYTKSMLAQPQGHADTTSQPSKDSAWYSDTSFIAPCASNHRTISISSADTVRRSATTTSSSNGLTFNSVSDGINLYYVGPGGIWKAPVVGGGTPVKVGRSGLWQYAAPSGHLLGASLLAVVFFSLAG